jgi:hypothetical protein
MTETMTKWHEEMEKFDKHFSAEMVKSKALKGLQIGKIFSVGVADGYAYYEIVKINKRTVQLRWRKDLCLDEYMDRILGEGGSFSRNIIESIIVGEDKLAEIFANL